MNELGHCSNEIFRERVSYEDLDMNHIPKHLYGKFDFCWSACAIEHVGSLDQSKAFLKNMLNVLKPGGIAIHTTEFNLQSKEKTITRGNGVIYREKDILEVTHWMSEHGHNVAELDFTRGNLEGDSFVDSYPCYAPPAKYHICLKEYPSKYYKLLYYFGGRKLENLFGYTCTSIGIIIRKNENCD